MKGGLGKLSNEGILREWYWNLWIFSLRSRMALFHHIQHCPFLHKNCSITKDTCFHMICSYACLSEMIRARESKHEQHNITIQLFLAFSLKHISKRLGPHQNLNFSFFFMSKWRAAVVVAPDHPKISYLNFEIQSYTY